MAGRESLKEGFFQECEDLLEAVSDGLARLEQGEYDAEIVNSVFRAVHSIKGGAGAFGLTTLVSFAHSFENLLDDLRQGAVQADVSVIQLLYRASDRLFDIVEAERTGRDPIGEGSAAKSYAALMAALQDACASSAQSQEDEDGEAASGFEPQALHFDLAFDLPELSGEEQTYSIEFKARKGLFASGNDPLALFSALGDMGHLEIEAEIRDVPDLAKLNYDECCLSWKLILRTDAAEEEIREIFEFVVNDAEIIIAQDEAQHPSILSAPEQVRETEEVATKSTAPEATQDQGALRKPEKARQSIRVDLERVDRLINLVGELVISEAMLTQSIAQNGIVQGTDVETALARLKQLSTELQERIMAIRAQSVKSLFQRMSRIVREASAATGRDVRLVTEGDSTEVDKTVIERLSDPLTHILRNAVDHGIESAEARKRAGKCEHGTVHMLAAHRSGQVIIEITDDGAGIDTQRVLEKAIAKGIVPADAELSAQETYHLLFEPGFSTAEQVSNLSGRGVGMDVVRSEIQALGGRVAITSQTGVGTTLTISLPLTLAVVEGMLVEVSGETLVVPSTALRETMRAEGAMVHSLGAGEPVLAIRGALIPIIDLGESLGFRAMPNDVSGCPLLLVESAAGKLVALLADRIIHQREVVIKGLAENYGHVRGIAAATILGNGRIALIIDIDQVAVTKSTGQDDTVARHVKGAK